MAIDCIYKSSLLGPVTSLPGLDLRVYSGLSALGFGDKDGVCLCVHLYACCVTDTH